MLDSIACQFTLLFHALLRKSFHIVRPDDGVRVGSLPAKLLFDRTCWDERFEQVVVFLQEFGLHSRCVRSNYTRSDGGVGIVCPIGFRTFLFSSFLKCRPHQGTETKRFCGAWIKSLSLEPFSAPFSIKTFSDCRSHSYLGKSVRRNFFCVVPRDLEFCPMSLGGGVMVDKSR